MEVLKSRFIQRNNFINRIELSLCPDYVEYSVSGTRGGTVGFNLKYESLPSEFYFRTQHSKDVYITFPLILIAALTPFELLVGRGGPFSTIAFMALGGLIYCALGYGLRHILKKPYTVLGTTAGNILIVKDRRHDLIVRELMARRSLALKRLAVVNPAMPAWQEVKRFKWLCDEGVISPDDFRAFREQILSSTQLRETAPTALALH